MFDSSLRPLIDPYLYRTAVIFRARGFSNTQIIFAGILIALIEVIVLSSGLFFFAFLLVVANRALNDIEKHMAHFHQPDVIDNNAPTDRSDFNYFFSVIADYVFYAGVPLGFALNHPGANGGAAAFLLFALILSGISALAFSATAANHGINMQAQKKGATYTQNGLGKTSEIIGAFSLMCLFPMFFDTLAILLALLYCIRAGGRMFAARLLLR